MKMILRKTFAGTATRLNSRELAILSRSQYYSQGIDHLSNDRIQKAYQLFSFQHTRITESMPEQINLRIYLATRLSIVCKILGKKQEFLQKLQQIFFHNLAFRGELDPDNIKFFQNMLLAFLAEGLPQTGNSLCGMVLQEMRNISRPFRILAGYYSILTDHEFNQQFKQELFPHLNILTRNSLPLKFNLQLLKFIKAPEPSHCDTCVKISHQIIKEEDSSMIDKLQNLHKQSPEQQSKFTLTKDASLQAVKLIADVNLFKGELYKAYSLYQAVLKNSNSLNIQNNLFCNTMLAIISKRTGNLELAENQLLLSLELSEKGSPCTYHTLSEYTDLLNEQKRLWQHDAYKKQLQKGSSRSLEILPSRLILPDFDFSY